jgi:hypothetical protein
MLHRHELVAFALRGAESFVQGNFEIFTQHSLGLSSFSVNVRSLKFVAVLRHLVATSSPPRGDVFTIHFSLSSRWSRPTGAGSPVRIH